MKKVQIYEANNIKVSTTVDAVKWIFRGIQAHKKDIFVLSAHKRGRRTLFKIIKECIWPCTTII